MTQVVAVIDSREYACPECGGHGHIVVEEDGKLRCGACEHRYTGTSHTWGITCECGGMYEPDLEGETME